MSNQMTNEGYLDYLDYLDYLEDAKFKLEQGCDSSGFYTLTVVSNKSVFTEYRIKMIDAERIIWCYVEHNIITTSCAKWKEVHSFPVSHKYDFLTCEVDDAVDLKTKALARGLYSAHWHYENYIRTGRA